MSEVVIKTEGLGKLYRLGQIGTGTLSHDFNRWWHRVRGKEDPYLRIGETNDRTKKGESDLVWAIRDISFEVRKGEVLGIIGKNGAGKSTLLKILSRVTAPSTGKVKVKGRIASLLEVGTGFHPELTGRENIFLNGAILGMTKSEIRAKFDEIVHFSGVERYIDTPVKRYSSGMYVRLAFAVAAHLEPEILIVDEVLAVGDAEFQKKCLGKMKDVSGEGRTVLFVSHNMPSIRALCSSAIIMKQGLVVNKGETASMISQYLSNEIAPADLVNGDIPEGLSRYNNGEAKFKKIFIRDRKGNARKELYFQENFSAEVHFDVYKKIENANLLLFILNSYGENIMMATDNEMYRPRNFEAGSYSIKVDFSEHLMPGDYTAGLALSYFHTGSGIDYVESVGSLKILKESLSNDMEYPWATVHGYIKPNTSWQINKI